jgi:hypothetical protein
MEGIQEIEVNINGFLNVFGSTCHRFRSQDYATCALIYAFYEHDPTTLWTRTELDNETEYRYRFIIPHIYRYLLYYNAGQRPHHYYTSERIIGSFSWLQKHWTEEKPLGYKDYMKYLDGSVELKGGDSMLYDAEALLVLRKGK